MEGWVAKVIEGLTPGGAGVWVIAAMVGLQHAKQWNEDRKLSAEDRIARREGYAKQVAELTAENRQQREEMQRIRNDADKARRLCLQENDQLRDGIIVLENKVAGIMRKMADIAIRAARGEIDAEMAASILQIATEVKE